MFSNMWWRWAQVIISLQNCLYLPSIERICLNLAVLNSYNIAIVSPGCVFVQNSFLVLLVVVELKLFEEILHSKNVCFKEATSRYFELF